VTPAEPKFDRVVRRTVSTEVRDAIAESIRSGELRPGVQLPPERELCDMFGVARTTIREATQGLLTLGLVEKRGNRSCVVERLPDVTFDHSDDRKQRIQELFQVRQIVEIPIARLACCHASESQRHDISAVAATFTPDMTLVDFRPLDRQFHWLVAQACGNATLAEIYAKVLESLFQSEAFDTLLNAPSNEEVVRDIIARSARAHKAIARAIGAGDWAAATANAEKHLDEVEDQMIKRMI
jgi:GntR family transcriptional repressor for pyruvate dehydrogenase complex